MRFAVSGGKVVKSMLCTDGFTRFITNGLDASREEFFFFFFTLVTGPRRSVCLTLSDTRSYEPQIRARLGTREELAEEDESLILDGPGIENKLR